MREENSGPPTDGATVLVITYFFKIVRHATKNAGERVMGLRLCDGPLQWMALTNFEQSLKSAKPIQLLLLL